MEVASITYRDKVISMEKFDPIAEVAELKKQTAAMRKRSYSKRKSRLDSYHTELMAMHKAGASVAELNRWLRKKKKVRVADSTVHRWLISHA